MVKTIIKIINYIIVVLTVLFVLLTVGIKLFGINMYTILSGSMEPEYPVGSLIYVKETPTDELVVGDVITFRLTGEVTATHRIIEILDGGTTFRTKGDANEDPDNSPVKSSEIVGKVVYQIPKGGYFVNYIQNPPGKYFAIGVAGFLILFVFVSDSFLDDKEDKNKKKTDDDNKQS